MNLEKLKMDRLYEQYKSLPERLKLTFNKRMECDRIEAMEETKRKLQIELLKTNPIISSEYIKKILGIDE